jgi:hypothetical protein
MLAVATVLLAGVSYLKYRARTIPRIFNLSLSSEIAGTDIIAGLKTVEGCAAREPWTLMRRGDYINLHASKTVLTIEITAVKMHQPNGTAGPVWEFASMDNIGRIAPRTSIESLPNLIDYYYVNVGMKSDIDKYGFVEIHFAYVGKTAAADPLADMVIIE